MQRKNNRDYPSFTPEWKNRFYLAQSYLQVSQNIMEEMLQTENQRVIISDHEISDAELIEGLRYSSPQTILPALFCLYQGIELILKGFVRFKEPQNRGHDAELLSDDFSKAYPKENELDECFRGFIHYPIDFIKKYMELNKINNMSAFYNSLRYPDNKRGDVWNYDILMYTTNKEFLPQIRNLYKDIERLMILSAKLFRYIEDGIV